MLRIITFFILVNIFLPFTYASDTDTPPNWIENPAEAYPESKYLAMAGEGTSRKEAETNAIESLAAIFSRNIDSQTGSSLNYTSSQNETAKIDKKIVKDISISTNVKDLAGVEIKEIWASGNEKYYALAVLDKAKAIIIYREKISSNNKTISELINIPDKEKNTIREFSRYNAAYKKAAENEVYASYLLILNPTASMISTKPDFNLNSLKMKCLDILKSIPIKITVEGDKNSKLKAAFSDVLTSTGFQTSELKNCRYVLSAKLTIDDEVISGNNKTIIRYSLIAEFIDVILNESLIPFSISGREIHFNKTNAESKALTVLEKKIKKDFKKVFEEYLNQ